MDVAVGLVGQRDNERAQTLADRIASTLDERGVDVVVDEATGTAVDIPAVPVSEMDDRDLVVSIGGDGTFLFVAREVVTVPIVGVNLGEVGFLNAVPPAEAVDAVSRLVTQLEETDTVDGRTVDRLRASTDEWSLEPALNEVVVHGPRRGRSSGIDIVIRVDGDEYAATHADGVLVATPTGSTAYNLSEDGPFLQPDLETVVITQMCAASAKPPLVVSSACTIDISVTGAETAYVISDGRNRRAVEPPTTISVSRADDPITIAGPEVNFFRALEKLE